MITHDAAVQSASPPQLTQDEASALARLRQEQAFIPSTRLEALVLQVVGGWDQLKAAVNALQFMDAGPGADRQNADPRLPAAMNKLAKKYRIRWPHDRFAAKVDHANKIRQRFAHFFFISTVVGDEPPDRTLYFTRLGNADNSLKTNRGAQGLAWRDDEVVRQYRLEDSITEQELRETLAELKSLIEWCWALRILAKKLCDDTHLPDDHSIDTEDWPIPWRTDKDPLLVLRDLRLGDDELEPSVSCG